MGEKVRFVIVPFEAAKDGIAYGFSKEEKLEKWLKATKRFDKYKEEKELEKRLEKKRTPEEYEEIKQYQIRLVKKNTEKYKNFLEKHNLKPEETEKRKAILEDHNPYFKFKSHSVHLFDGIFFMLPWKNITLKGGHSYCGKRYYLDYPDLGIFNFDNKAESLIVDCGSYGTLFTDVNLRGAWCKFYTHIPNLDWLNYGFRNSISSVRVY